MALLPQVSAPSLTIMTVGMTSVFVPKDLEFMGGDRLSQLQSGTCKSWVKLCSLRVSH